MYRLAIFSLAIACSAQTQPRTSIGGPPTTFGPADGLAEISGAVLETGTSRGKTLAAWNGIATGRGWLRIAGGPGESTLVELPPWLDSASFADQRVRLTGRWHPPGSSPMPRPGEPIAQMPVAQMPVAQMPIHQSGPTVEPPPWVEPPSGWGPVPREGARRGVKSACAPGSSGAKEVTQGS